MFHRRLKNESIFVDVRKLSRAMKQKNQEQIEAAAKFSVGLGAICLVLFIFVDADWGTKLRGAAAGLVLLGWGSRQLALASKRKKLDSENTGKENGSDEANGELQLRDKRLEEQLEELDQSGSVKNVLTLLSWILLFVFLACAICVGYLFLFHRRQ
jgi:hypothetical protein